MARFWYWFTDIRGNVEPMFRSWGRNLDGWMLMLGIYVYGALGL